jgi:hypothetical protein
VLGLLFAVRIWTGGSRECVGEEVVSWSMLSLDSVEAKTTEDASEDVVEELEGEFVVSPSSCEL